MDFGNYIVYGLVFAAVAAVAVALLRVFTEAAKASEERIDLENRGSVGRRQGAPIERFVSAGRLFRIRLVSAALLALLFPAVFLSAGIRNPWVSMSFVAVFGGLGWALPKFYFDLLVRNRQLRFEDDILDLTLGIDNALRAGMALPQALEKIAERMHGVMREELGTVLREYRLGIDLVQALERLHERMPCEDIRLLVSAIRLTTQAGGSLAEVLKEMSAVIRGRREFQDKVKTLTAQGKFEAIAMSLAPVAAFIFLYFIQPELMRVLYTTVPGWCTLGAVAALDIVGYIVIRKIVSIEV